MASPMYVRGYYKATAFLACEHRIEADAAAFANPLLPGRRAADLQLWPAALKAVAARFGITVDPELDYVLSAEGLLPAAT